MRPGPLRVPRKFCATCQRAPVDYPRCICVICETCERKIDHDIIVRALAPVVMPRTPSSRPILTLKKRA